jgi:hypothetical protein
MYAYEHMPMAMDRHLRLMYAHTDYVHDKHTHTHA